ncbi:MAG: glutamine amidotransferase [Kineosporiaceae bacterium]
MRPFLLLATRAEDAAADGEYEAFLRFGGLGEHELTRVRLERGPLRDEIGEFDPEDWSGVVVGGGPFNASDSPTAKSPVQRRVEAEISALLDRVVDADSPFLGACYGIGTLGVHQGAVVDRTFGEPVGAAEVSLTSEGTQDPVFGALPRTFTAFVGHKEAVSRLPAHAVRLASSPACPVQAFRIGRHVYATQFHPELDVAGICTRIDVYRHAGYFLPDEADALKSAARAATVVHPPAVLRRFVERFARRGRSGVPRRAAAGTRPPSSVTGRSEAPVLGQ